MKSRSSAVLCQNAKISHPCTTPITSLTLWKNVNRRNSQWFIMLLCKVWLTLNLSTHQRMSMTVSQALTTLLDNSNASLAGASKQNESTDLLEGYVVYVEVCHEFYRLSFGVLAWSFLSAVPPQWKLMLLFLLPPFNQAAPPILPKNHHKLLTQCLTNPTPSFGIWHPHTQMSKQRSLSPLYWIKEE